jgi:putative ABC transport system substrate-binding protein
MYRLEDSTMRLSAIGLMLTLTLGLLVAPLTAKAQPPRQVPRIAFLSLSSREAVTDDRFEAFQQELRELGYVEGQTVAMEFHWAQGRFERLQELTAELVRRQVAVIVSLGPGATRAAKNATSTIPIIMANDYDPVGDGFVASLGRPGGNITGMSGINRELSAKRLELLKEAVPGLTRVAVLWNPAFSELAALRETEEAAHTLALQVHALAVRGPDEFEGAFRVATREHAEALTVLRDPVSFDHRTRLVELAAQYRLPAMYWERDFVEAGGLMSYAASDRHRLRRVAYFVDKVLKGAKPADLPVEQPMQFELVINLKTAKALGITMPPSLLVLANEVIR